ncbi:MAG: carbon-nitrogen hydrolase family protein [Candidatus Micrarchaeota archaeon]
MRLALAQMEITYDDAEANLGKMRRFIARAKKRKADVVVFPEDSLSGPVRGRKEHVDGNGLSRKRLSSLARSGRIDVVGCFIESVEGRWLNTACYFDRSGRLLGEYRKINLWHGERQYISPGKDVRVFDTRFGKAGLAICWDLANPLLFRRMAGLGARVIFVPSFWSDAGISNYRYESRNIDSLCFVRALENECAIAYANAAGSYRPGDSLIGHSQVTVPIRGALKKAAHNRETLIVADVPEAPLARAAKVYKIRKDILSGYPG